MLVFDEPYPWVVIRPDNADAVVVGPVINDEELKILETLSQDAVYALSYIQRSIIHRHANGHERSSSAAIFHCLLLACAYAVFIFYVFVHERIC